jgi:endonuclease/exonuclease/phosphatase family metal-dependent hydrolase
MNFRVIRKFSTACFVLIVFVSCSESSFGQGGPVPEFFTHEELIELYDQPVPSAKTQKKLETLLTTPFVFNNFVPGSSPRLSSSESLGAYLRVALWNIERGLQFEGIVAALTDQKKFAELLDTDKFPEGSDERKLVLDQLEALRNADVIILNEVDWGMKRTEYRNVAAELAAALRMNYAFGTQFIELSPVNMSREEALEDEDVNEMLELIRIDPKRYKGIHGLAVLSRYKLENVRLVPFEHVPYDWYASEKKGPSTLEKGKRKSAEVIFLEKSLQEVRKGGRTTLYADIEDSRFPSGKVTIVATHLENRSKPKGRVKQMSEILRQIWSIDSPVVMGGDMNTSGKDLRPTSLSSVLAKRYGSPDFWIKKGLKYSVGFGLVQDVMMKGFNAARTQGDPTVKNVPFAAPNPERKFFAELEDYWFSDRGTFDFRGDNQRTSNGRSGTLANSNERADKGFVKTFKMPGSKGSIGKYKLDWIFVKPAALKKSDDKNGSYRFAPHFGRTLLDLNDALELSLSDHRPMIVDLPLEEPEFGLDR